MRPGAENAEEGSSSSRELDQLFLLHAAALQTGEGLARWWFRFRAEAQDANTAESLDDLLRDSLQSIGYGLGADAVAVLLADEDSGELVIRAAIGMQPELWREVHIAAGAGMAGRVLAERKPLIVADLSTIEVASPTLRESGVRSLVAVPIMAGGRVVGVLHADSYELSHFGRQDATLLTLVADRMGAAIQQVRLFELERAARADAEAVAERLARLQRVTASLSRELSAEAVAEALIAELVEDVEGEPTSYLVWIVDGDRLRLLRGSPASPRALAFTDMSLDAPLPGPEVVRTGRPLWLESRDDIEAFGELREAKTEAEAIAVLPLTVEEQVIGVLAVAYQDARQFSEDERRFLVVVARQAAESLQRAAVRRSRQRGSFANAVLADVSAALGSSLDRNATLRLALEELVPRVADMATFHVFDDMGVPRRVALAHRDPATDAELADAPQDAAHEARSVMAALEAAGTRAMLLPRAGPQLASDVGLDEEHGERLRQLDMSSAIAVPLVARGEVVGLMGLLRLGGSDPFEEEDLDLATEVGLRASDAIDNALQHERRVAVARALQASLLPPELSEVPGAEVAALFHPAGSGVDVGGDFYDLFPVDDSRWVLMIGDVSGSGPAAAALTAQVRHGARVAARAGLDPASVVSAVNATLDETTGSEWFCTMVYAELVPHRDGIDLQVICAGHVPPVVVRSGAVEQLECQAPLLGVMPSATFAADRLRLAPGHALVMVTDGATEARRHGERGSEAFFGEDRVLEVIAKAADGDAQRLVDAIAGAVMAHAGGQLDDDLAVVALRALPGPVMPRPVSPRPAGGGRRSGR